MGLITNILNKFGKQKFEGKNRQDKDFQSQFQSAIDKGRAVQVNDVKSSRYSYNRSGSLYDDKEIMDKDIASGNTDAQLKENSVSSTAVESFNYNPKTQDLNIKYRNGNQEYTFPNVPPEVVKEFMDAPSKGKYLAYNIKPKYGV